jgi:putative CocE/NonD family hydrolase
VLSALALAAPAAAWADADHLSSLQNRLPTADPGPAPRAVEPGVVETFDARASSDPDGEVVRAMWDFGDGTHVEGLVAEHAYERPGAYLAHLTVTDDRGAFSSAPLMVHVSPQPELVTETVKVPVSAGYSVNARITRPADGDRHPVVVRYSIYCLQFNEGDEALVRSGYAFVHAEAPGVCDSGGRFDLWGDAVGVAGRDLIEWLAAQPWSDGNVGLVGHSGAAITGLSAARAKPPHLRTAVLGSTFVDPYRDIVYPGGVLTGAAAEYNAVLMAELRPGMQPSERAQGWLDWERDVLAHSTDDAYWHARSLAADYGALEIPTYMLSSWNDLFARGALEFFRGRANPNSRVAMYPGPHWPFDPTGELGYRAARDQEVHLGSEERVWLDHWLRGIGRPDRRPPLSYFQQEGGAAAAQAFSAGDWREAGRWPPRGTHWQRQYLRPDGALAEDAPAEPEALGALTPQPTGLADPRWLDFWSAAGHRPYDGRPVWDAPDQRADDARSLTFTTRALESPLPVAGPITLSFSARLAGTDGAFFATLSDVWPDGSAHVLSSGMLRASMRAVDDERSLRNGDGEIARVWHPHDHAEPVEPGALERYVVEIWPTASTFAPGHRLQLSLALGRAPWHSPEPLAGAAVLDASPTEPAYLLLPLSRRKPPRR